jgi:hypothetical protein
MRCIAVLALSVLLTVPAAAQTPAAGAPHWSVGDNWKYQELIYGKQMAFEVAAWADRHYTVVATLEDSVRVAVVADDTLSIRDFVEFRWPLAVGRSWESGGGGSPLTGDDRPSVWRIAWTVTGYEPVAVMAGGFDAYRIDAHACAADEGRCGDFSVWYAPKAKWVVKYTLSSAAFWGRAAGRIWQLTKYVVH